MFRFITVNKARCLKCNDVVVSNSDTAGTMESCSCGSLKISGGSTALVRNGIPGKDYEELSKMNFDGECPPVNEDTQDPPPEQGALIDEIKQKYRK